MNQPVSPHRSMTAENARMQARQILDRRSSHSGRRARPNSGSAGPLQRQGAACRKATESCNGNRQPMQIRAVAPCRRNQTGQGFAIRAARTSDWSAPDGTPTGKTKLDRGRRRRARRGTGLCGTPLVGVGRPRALDIGRFRPEGVRSIIRMNRR